MVYKWETNSLQVELQNHSAGVGFDKQSEVKDRKLASLLASIFPSVAS